MPSVKNKIVIACAGSGKTTFIVKEALKLKKSRVLVTTYTNENIDEIKKYFIKENGCVPTNVTVQSWFSFLLQEGVRPYQNFKTDRGRARSVYFFSNNELDKKLKQHLLYVSENDDAHYFSKANFIYEDKVSKFICKCNECSGGLVIKRLENIYDYIFLDELQDFACYDLDLLELFFKSKIEIIAVGDPRQATFSTHNAQRNKQYKKDNIHLWLEDKKTDGQIVIEEVCFCYRCNQSICDFADQLFPEMPKAISKNKENTKHDGIFYITSDKLNGYIENFKPIILRYNIRANTFNFDAVNIGLSKGRTYDRVLIFPTAPMLEYLRTKDLTKAGDKSKLYIAATRARYSVTFVVEKKDLKLLNF